MSSRECVEIYKKSIRYFQQFSESFGSVGDLDAQLAVVRLMRNLLSSRDIQERLYMSLIIETHLLDQFRRNIRVIEYSLIKALYQLLHNYANGNADTAESLWKHLSPHIITHLQFCLDRVETIPSLLSTLTALIYAMSRQSSSFREYIVREGISVIESIIQVHHTSVGADFDENDSFQWTHFLLLYLIDAGLLGEMLSRFSSSSSKISVIEVFMEHINDTFPLERIQLECTQGLVQSIEESLEFAETLVNLDHDMHHALFCLLKSFARIYWDWSSLAHLSDHLALFCACLLKNLPDAKSVRLSDERYPEGSEEVFMLKTTLMRVIGNASYGSTVFKTVFGHNGGVEMTMNACKIDTQNPYLKEWAIFALRNLVQEHDTNKKRIEQLKLAGISNMDELKSIGIDATYDVSTGGIKITKR